MTDLKEEERDELVSLSKEDTLSCAIPQNTFWMVNFFGCIFLLSVTCLLAAIILFATNHHEHMQKHHHNSAAPQVTSSSFFSFFVFKVSQNEDNNSKMLSELFV